MRVRFSRRLTALYRRRPRRRRVDSPIQTTARIPSTRWRCDDGAVRALDMKFYRTRVLCNADKSPTRTKACPWNFRFPANKTAPRTSQITAAGLMDFRHVRGPANNVLTMRRWLARMIDDNAGDREMRVALKYKSGPYAVAFGGRCLRSIIRAAACIHQIYRTRCLRNIFGTTEESVISRALRKYYYSVQSV